MRKLSLFLIFVMLSLPLLAQEEEEERKEYSRGFSIGAHNSNRGWGMSFNYMYGINPSNYVISLDVHAVKDLREALTSPFIGDQGRRYVYGKLNHFWVASPMFGIFHNAIPRGSGNILKMRLGLKVGPSIGITNPYQIELYQAVAGRPFSPDFIIVPYNPDEHSFGEIVGRAGIWSSEFDPGFQLGFSTHGSAMLDLSRSESAIHGIELGLNADIFFKEVPLLAPIRGISNKKVFISVSAGLIFGGRW